MHRDSPPQLFSLVIFLLCLAIMNMFYPGNRGAMYTAAIVLYALTAGTAGFVSAHMYCRFYGADGRWACNLVLSATLFPAPFLLMFCFLNTVAIAYNSQAALPFGTILVITLIWALVTLPLTVIGGVLGLGVRVQRVRECLRRPVRHSRRRAPPVAASCAGESAAKVSPRFNHSTQRVPNDALYGPRLLSRFPRDLRYLLVCLCLEIGVSRCLLLGRLRQLFSEAFRTGRGVGGEPIA